MKLREIMSRDVQVVHPDETLQMAAQKMRDHDIGFLPVCEGDRLVGVVTDRDLALRGIAAGVNSKAMLGRDLMTTPILYCYDDQDVDEAAKVMEEHQIRRVAVLSRDDKRLVGVVSLGDIAKNATKEMSAEVLQSVSEPA
jgi:CBS domain-containing protein